ncbi:MAG: DUF368 domain-containing protein [Acidimicrobiia bacterium]|nr:DUF368 domain-containing protein [Acidimicrobiia bacterium]
MLRESLFSIGRGFAMGAADIVPGVSGGTIALVLGIYERLVASIKAGSSAIGNLIKGDVTAARRWIGAVEWLLILPLGLGILAAIVALSQLIESLLHDQPVAMASLFTGLVVGSIAIAWRMIRTPSGLLVGVVLAVGLAVFLVLGFRPGTTEASVDQVTEPALWAFFLSGAIAICAMILPGISGSFILVILGMYGAVLGAVNDRDGIALIVFTLGAVVGLGLFSQVLDWALKTRHDLVMAALVGLMVGSLRVLWPWPNGVDSTALGAPDDDIGLAIVLGVIGFVVVMALNWVANRMLSVEAANEPLLDGH